ncbi:MAG: hypothetical protein RIC82_04340, partial [Parvibaculum sp.]
MFSAKRMVRYRRKATLPAKPENRISVKDCILTAAAPKPGWFSKPPEFESESPMPMTYPDVSPVHSAVAARSPSSGLGELPDWNLTDLYPGRESPEFKLDMAAARERAAKFETVWKG